MDDFAMKDMEEASRAIASMIGRTEKAKDKFAQGTSQYTLQRNRLKALQIASALIAKELVHSDAVGTYTVEELKEALTPIASLMSKSEKAKGKLAQDTWQYRMLEDNLNALYIASSLLAMALSERSAKEERME